MALKTSARAADIPSMATTRVGRLAAIVGAIALVQSVSSTPAAAQSAASVVSALGDVRNAVIEASLDTYRGQSDEALVSLDQALLTLGQVRDALTDPALRKALSRKLKTAEGKAGKARRSVAGGQRITVQLKKLRVAASAVRKATLAAGHPAVDEIDTLSAGFYYPATWFSCSSTRPTDRSASNPRRRRGERQRRIGRRFEFGGRRPGERCGLDDDGPRSGLARVTITACGQTTTVLLFNYGPEAPKGLPKGFPINVPLGTYEVTVSGEIAGAPFPRRASGRSISSTSRPSPTRSAARSATRALRCPGSRAAGWGCATPATTARASRSRRACTAAGRATACRAT
jgi:hypothetical protein